MDYQYLNSGSCSQNPTWASLPCFLYSKPKAVAEALCNISLHTHCLPRRFCHHSAFHLILVKKLRSDCHHAPFQREGNWGIENKQFSQGHAKLPILCSLRKIWHISHEECYSDKKHRMRNAQGRDTGWGRGSVGVLRALSLDNRKMEQPGAAGQLLSAPVVSNSGLV